MADVEDRDSVDDVLARDHEELGRTLEALRARIDDGSPQAPEILRGFADGLKRHMRWEEEVLFPALRPRLDPAGRRSLESLEIDHARILEALAAVGTGLEAGDAAEARRAASWLDVLLAGHNRDEEFGAYEEADRLFGAVERRALLERFRDA